MAKKKSWHEKLHDAKDLLKVEQITAKMRKSWGAGTVAIPAPIEVDAAPSRDISPQRKQGIDAEFPRLRCGLL